MEFVLAYHYPNRVNLTHTRDMFVLRNLSMDNREVKFWKGFANSIEFSIKNSDRKPYAALGKVLHCMIVNIDKNEVVLNRELEVIDEYKGRYKVQLYPRDIDNWDVGFYRYVVTHTDAYNDEYLFYSDQGFQVLGKIELKDYVSNVKDSIQMKFEDFLVKSPEQKGFRFYTQMNPGSAQSHYNTGLHSYSVKYEKFTGTLKVEASLDNQPNNYEVENYSSSWFTVASHEIENKTGVELYNFEASYMWVRFRIETENKTIIPAELIPILDNNGGIQAIIIKNPGDNYTNAPLVQITPDYRDIIISQATASVTIDGFGKIIEVSVTNPGDGYMHKPDIKLLSTQIDPGRIAKIVYRA